VDGNSGHTQIDFGGQWLMGRMMAKGHGRELYHRQRQWMVLRESYRTEMEPPVYQQESLVPGSERKIAYKDDDLRHDADKLMSWVMGEDPPEWKKVGGAVAAPLAQPPNGNPFVAIALQKAAVDAVTPEVEAAVTKPAIGGPLYPPVQALYYAPLGAIDSPQRAYRIFQVFLALLVPVAGLGVKILTRGRIWWSVATLCVFLYPGTRGGLDLGQNPTLSLTILIWGWALASRGYYVAGGMVWGLFAFKPVWALAFLLVPLLMRKWRFFLAMALTGAGLILLTLPFVGIDTWFHWLRVGKSASDLYRVNENWIDLSRDLHGIPRRILHDYNVPHTERDKPVTNALAWALWAFVFGGTVITYLVRGDRTRVTGLSPAFLLLGAYLTCYRFMYYDVLLSALVLTVLLVEPLKFLRGRAFSVGVGPPGSVVPLDRELQTQLTNARPFGARMLGYVNCFPLTIVMCLYVQENALSGMDLRATVGYGFYERAATDGSTNKTMPQVQGNTGTRYPTDTYLLIVLWMWCGWRLWRGKEQPDAEPPDAKPLASLGTG
jgi:arabinofuranan 3-O-arabinosyltransferase